MLEINKFNRIIAANWKLNGSFGSVESYLKSMETIINKEHQCSIICPPFVYLGKFSQVVHQFYIGAQDCSNFKNGPYTGDISADMLKDNNCQFCIVGHSERRQIFNQTNQDVMLKTSNLIAEDINPIVCIGETLDDKKQGKTRDVLRKQLIESLPKNSSNNSVVIAYEPIWAIGSGHIPTLDEINDIHFFIKNDIKGYENYKILYGGSVKSSNSMDIISLDNVDGLLVGGASLDPVEFGKILKL